MNQYQISFSHMLFQIYLHSSIFNYFSALMSLNYSSEISVETFLTVLSNNNLK